jgi:hypothetical protein
MMDLWIRDQTIAVDLQYKKKVKKKKSKFLKRSTRLADIRAIDGPQTQSNTTSIVHTPTRHELRNTGGLATWICKQEETGNLPDHVIHVLRREILGCQRFHVSTRFNGRASKARARSHQINNAKTYNKYRRAHCEK